MNGRVRSFDMDETKVAWGISVGNQALELTVVEDPMIVNGVSREAVLWGSSRYHGFPKERGGHSYKETQGWGGWVCSWGFSCVLTEKKGAYPRRAAARV